MRVGERGLDRREHGLLEARDARHREQRREREGAVRAGGGGAVGARAVERAGGALLDAAEELLAERVVLLDREVQDPPLHRLPHIFVAEYVGQRVQALQLDGTPIQVLQVPDATSLYDLAVTAPSGSGSCTLYVTDFATSELHVLALELAQLKGARTG